MLTAVLIGGPPRSGTTLLVDLLNENSNIGLFSEYVFDDLLRTLEPLLAREHDISMLDAVVRGREPAALEDLIPEPCSEEVLSETPSQWTAAAPARSYVFANNDRVVHSSRFPTLKTFPKIVESVFGASLGKDDLAVVGTKYPFFPLLHDPTYVGGLLGRQPKYIFMLRDPIMQINSSINRRNRATQGIDAWHVDTVENAVHELRSMCCIIISYIFHFGSDVLIVKYEDLTEKRDETLRKIYDFVELGELADSSAVPCVRTSVRVLSPDEWETVDNAFANASADWPQRVITGSKNVTDMFAGLLEPYPPTPHEVELNPGTAGRPLLGLGWHHAFMPDGALSNAPDSYLVFAMRETGKRRILIQLAPHYGESPSPFACDISVNGASALRVNWQPPASQMPVTAQVSTQKAPSLTVVGADAVLLDLGTFDFVGDNPNHIRLTISKRQVEASANPHVSLKSLKFS